MLKRHGPGYLLAAVLTLGGLVGGGMLWSSGVLAPPPAASPPGLAVPVGQVAEVDGLAVTYNPARPGLTVLTNQTWVGDGGRLRGAAPAWREVFWLEPRVLVGDVWEAPLPDQVSARRPTVVTRRDQSSMVIHLEDLAVGDASLSSWSLTLSRTTPTLTLDRIDRLVRPGGVAALGVAVTAGPNEVHQRVVLVSGTAYTLADRGIERLGNHGLNGVVHRDPALTFTVAGAQVNRARGERQGERDRLVLGTNRLPGSLLPVQTSLTIHVGPLAPLQATTARFGPATEQFLLATGYYGNVFVSQANGRVLTASMRSYPDSVWIGDVAMATRGYGYVLNEAGVQSFRNTLDQFLKRTDAAGVVPEYFNEAGQAENRGAWDAMPDLIHGVHAYVSRTRDIAFLTDHYDTLVRVCGWMRRLDSDDDGLPDQDIYPYGYYDSVENGVMHTYAIASFYAAHLELAELAELLNRDGAPYRQYAERMRAAYNRPLAEGGYWQPGRSYPIAWKKADGRVIDGFETFGVLAAIRWGLIVDEGRLDEVGRYLREQREAFVNGHAYPVRLMIDGYDPALLRAGVPAEQRWLLDANAPWIVAHDVAVRARLGAPDQAAVMLARYEDGALHYPPMPEFGASAGGRQGAGETPDGGRLWDNSAWFDAVYGTHYGLRMTPQALVIEPTPLRRVTDDVAEGLTYQGLRFRLTLRPDGYTVELLEGASRLVTFRPLGQHAAIAVNGNAALPSQTVMARPGEVYTVVSLPAATAGR